MKLQPAISQYLRLKRSLGFRFGAERVILHAFGRAMGRIDLRRVKPIKVRSYLYGSGPLTRFWERKWVTLRGFYRFALARGLVRQSPVPTVPPKLPPAFVPYIFSKKELRQLLAAIPPHPLAGLPAPALRTLLLLLYGSGLRISEALALNAVDVNFESRLLIVRQSKFFKSRYVPLGRRLALALSDYVQGRRCRRSGHRRAFFRTAVGTPVSRSSVETAFRFLRRTADVKRVDGARYQPRLHDLRHTFAVHRLVAWYRQGADLQKLLPKLSTFLGHVDLAATQRYLTLTSELAQHANRRFERYALEGGDHE